MATASGGTSGTTPTPGAGPGGPGPAPGGGSIDEGISGLLWVKINSNNSILKMPHHKVEILFAFVSDPFVGGSRLAINIFPIGTCEGPLLRARV